MKKSGKDRLKCAACESTLSTAARSPFPNGEGKEEAASPQKESQPRLAALVSPFQGKGLAWSIPPSYGRRCPEGAEVGWGKRYEREGDCLKYAIIREYPIHRYPHIVRVNTCMCGKTIPLAKPSPRGEGGEQNEPDRVLAV